MRRIAAIALGLTALVAAIAPAGAGATWTRFSPLAVSSVFSHVGITRSADGVLHVAWLANENSQSETVMHTSFSPAGKLGATTTMSSGWSTLDPPALLTAPDGSTLVGYWGGIIQNDPNHQELNAASSTNGGATWTLTPYNLVSGQEVGMDTMSAARLGNNYYQAWGAFLHFGNTTSPVFQFTASGNPSDCCGYDATVTAQSSPSGVLTAWYSNQTNHDGVYVQGVDPNSGQPLGSPSLMPGTAGVGKALVPPALVARSGAPGILLAYKSGSPVGTRVLVWAAGSPKAITLGTSQRDVDNFDLAPDVGGRVWAVWETFNTSGHAQIVVRRSNGAATAWGQPVLVNPPNNTDLWSLSANATGTGSLDVVGAFGNQGQIAEYQTRVLPGLSVGAKPSKLHRKHKTKVKFTVLDAGTPVKGAKVKVGKVSGTTSSKGTVTLKLGPFGPKVRNVVANITAPGYTATSLQLAVR